MFQGFLTLQTPYSFFTLQILGIALELRQHTVHVCKKQRVINTFDVVELSLCSKLLTARKVCG